MGKTPKNDGETGRRTFLKTVAAAGSLAAVVDEPLLLQAQEPPAVSESANAIAYPRVFRGNRLKEIAFPLGGVGAGSISLGGRGQLRDWEIFNRPDKGNSPDYALASIWTRSGNGKPVARVLESRILPPYQGASGLGSANMPGMPRLASATFTGEFPLARIDFEDDDLPVRVSLEAFTPFIPLDAEESGLPVAVLRYRISNPGGAPAKAAIAFSIDNPVGKEGRSNVYRKGDGIEGLVMSNPFLAATDPLAGSFALAALNAPPARITYLRGWRGATGWHVGPLLYWDDFSADGELGPEAPVRNSVGSLCVQRDLAPGAHADITFILAWHFRNRTPERSGWSAPKGDERTVIGNHYTTRFKDAWEPAQYLAAHLEQLESRTRRFTQAMRDTTLPDEVREGAMANLSTLVVPTSFRIADGTFHGFEGCDDHSGCCFGNCTHVWNYEAATECLFPSLAQSLRETSFGYSTDAEGLMDFREKLPEGKEHWGIAAADGQMGQLMKLYFDWRMGGDTEWLRRLWPAAKRALAFAWIPGGWDANKDGVMEGVQHNTYDVEFYGPNPLCGIWYLGALRAMEEMARVVGDTAAAAEYHGLFESGSKWIDANLFNGDYYIQKIRAIPRADIAKGLTAGMGAHDPEHPDFQLGDGCLVDQLLGQYFADVAGLGLLLDASHIRKTLESIYKYNYKRSMYTHESVQRTYALNDEAALVICAYPRGERPENPFPYFQEVMTGFEYAAAILMLHRGMTAQGIELIGNIRRRYDGERRNPWDEAECGHHYARAMASWAAIPALGGFRYHGVEKSVRAIPIVNEHDFRSFWSCGAAWGTFSQKLDGDGKRFELSVASGDLPLRSIELGWKNVSGARVSVEGREVAHRNDPTDDGTRFVPGREVVVKEGERFLIQA